MLLYKLTPSLLLKPKTQNPKSKPEAKEFFNLVGKILEQLGRGHTETQIL